MNFMIVRSMSPYNGIIGRSSIREIQAVPSTAHGMLKFPVDGGIITIRITILILAECATMITSPNELPKEAGVHHENFNVAIHPNFPDQEVAIGGTLFADGQTRLCTLLKENLDIFAWQPSDMTGVPRSVAEHRLNIQEGYSPVRQKKGPGPRSCESHPTRGTETSRGGDHERSLLRRLAVQSSHGYHQIQMAELDEEKIAFHTSQGVYCFTKMPFGLKNADATYQQLVDKAFYSQVIQNIEVYVDDLVIKSYTEAEMLRDIEETFRTLHKINMKLNLKKCTFGAVEGMFLGYTITPEGIKPCPTKQKLFLFKSTEKSLPLFKTLKKCIKKSDFHWTSEAEQAFMQLKQHLSELPLLVAPKPKEELIIYLSASYGVVSAVLLTERGTVQMPVYFISRALQGPELNYTPMEKLVLLLVFTAKRLRRTSVKGQILAYFLVEKPDENPPDTPVVETPPEPCIMFTNGSSCVDGSGASLILTSPEGTEFTYALRFQFTASNNEAEYEALIVGLRIATQMGVRNVQVSVDSKLVANQVLGTYVAKEENMVKYLEKVKSLVSGFAKFSISQVPRSKNKKADALSKIASTSFAHLSKQVLVEILKEKSIQEEEVATVIEEEETTWMTLIIEYLKDGTLPGKRKEAGKLRIKARQYELLEGVFYKRSFLKSWLRCVRPLQAKYVIREIHEGSCSMHAGPRSVVAKAMRLGNYWPTMHRDAREMIPGPFPEGPGKVKFLIAAMDYFTKWIEAKAVATITGNQVKKFAWDNILCRFGLPGEIISDNGKQFSDNPFKDWCDKLNIPQRFASVKYPQSNGLVEELHHVLWAHRIMIKSSYGDTPFSLTYGTEAVIPAEIKMPTYRTVTVDAVHNDEELQLNLDLLEEKRERLAICEAKAKRKMTKYYNARVRGVTFRPGDFVYHSN
ncbi:reverse transcriptase domain-containing protein [Tanacetum coccineum]|uniref:Reverse transcriptase domain-containing protein n=1 Tax=Tanacetum coccineum TaxID=301880 RepID=A0ABQ5B2G8_9ASTR